jgi:hypothetical protein
MISNGYCSLADVKNALRISDAVDDSLIEIAIEAASREIDGFAGRVFFQTTEARVYNPQDSFVVQTDDIVTVTTVKTSSMGTSYDTTWATADYQLEPLNGISNGLDIPYTRIRAIGQSLFPIWSITGTPYNAASVQVTGTFGWANIPTAVRQAAILLSMRQFKRFDSPLGVMGYGDMGAIRVSKIDPDVQALLQPYRRMSIA